MFSVGLLSLLFNGFSDFFLKKSSNSSSAPSIFFRTLFCSFPVVGIFIFETSKNPIQVPDVTFFVLISISTAVFMNLAIYFALKALNKQNIANSLPIIRMAFIITFIITVITGESSLNSLNIFSILLMIAAIYLLNQKRSLNEK